MPCLTIAGSVDYPIDPLAGHPAINKWYRFVCTGRGASVNNYWFTYYLSIGILSIHCVIVPVSGVTWLFCHRRHIVTFHVNQHNGDGDVVQLPSKKLDYAPGTILGLKL